MSDGGLSPQSPPEVHSIAHLLLCDLAAWFSLRPRSFSETLAEFLKNRRPPPSQALSADSAVPTPPSCWRAEPTRQRWQADSWAGHYNQSVPWALHILGVTQKNCPPCPPHCCCVISRPGSYLQEMAHQCWNHIHDLDSEISYSGETSLFAPLHPLLPQ